MRLDQALRVDASRAARSWPLRLYLLLQVVAGVAFVVRRGESTISTVALIWLGMLVLAFTAWYAGRHRLAHPRPDPVPAAGARTFFARVGVAGATLGGFGLAAGPGFVLVACALAGWLWAAWRSGGLVGVAGRLSRDPRPFLPMLLLIGLPRLLVGGPAFVVGAVAALPSGIGQQLLFLPGLFAPLEAVSRRPAAAAVLAGLLFGLVHVPLVLDANDGDPLAAVANAVLFQSSVGLIACLAYQRHRAAVPIGVAHALAIG